jgi:putative oxidoreductase
MTDTTQTDTQAPYPARVTPIYTTALTAIGLLAALYAAVTYPDSVLPLQAKIFMPLWLALSVACSVLLTPRSFTAGFLTGLLAMLIGWRVAGLNSVDIVSDPLIFAFIAFVLQFFECMRADLGGPKSMMTGAEWHLTFIRVYVGFDLVPHTTEKLFAGPSSFDADVKAFAGFGLPMPEFFVILGGLCEIGIAIGIGLGVLTRLAGVCSALYFLIATLIGGHFLNGFIWANSGGGWEYPVLMMALFLSFAVRGAGPFSLDYVAGRLGVIPTSLRPLTTPGLTVERRAT